MKKNLSFIALCAALACSQHSLAQTASVTVTGSANDTAYGSAGAVVSGPAGGVPRVTTTVVDIAGNGAGSSVTSTSINTAAVSATSASTTSQTATTFRVQTPNTEFQVGGTVSGLVFYDATNTVASGTLSSSNAQTVGTFDAGSALQHNGSYSAYNAATGVDLTEIGSYDATQSLTTGLRVNGTTGTNTLVGRTSTSGITNTGNIATTTLSTTGNAAVGGALAVAGTSTTHGIVNTGNISTGSLTATGNAAVGGDLAVAGRTSTQGIDNNGQVISNVGAGVAATDAATVGQLNGVSANQAALNAAQANTNMALQNQTVDNRRIASTGTAIVAAAAAIPPLEAGKEIGLGAGVGTYDGRSAVAVGLAARVSPALQIRLHIGTGNGGKVAAGAGGMWSW